MIVQISGILEKVIEIGFFFFYEHTALLIIENTSMNQGVEVSIEEKKKEFLS